MLATIGRIATASTCRPPRTSSPGYGDVDTTIRRAVQFGVAGAEHEARVGDSCVRCSRPSAYGLRVIFGRAY